MFRSFVILNYYKQNKINFRCKHEWKLPEGFDTGIKVYNTRTQTKVPLIFPNKHYVKWYMCGPTVYDSPHIGHASCYIRLDIIRRILKAHFDVDPVVAIGVTDVAEEIWKRSVNSGETVRSISVKYEEEFFKAMDDLNVLPPNLTLRVYHHLPVITEFVNRLVDKKVAYSTPSGIYYSVKTDKNYGRFQTPVEEARYLAHQDKRHTWDFALWKYSRGKQDGSARKTETGDPGWHIECSAMASHVFGSSVDIHSGASDLIFPHHENEETQSTAYHGCDQWVNYWIHTGLLNVKQEKMSKSKGNFLTVSDFLDAHSADTLRMFCLLTHYNKVINYDEENMTLAMTSFNKILRFLQRCNAYASGTGNNAEIDEALLFNEIENFKAQMKESFSDDFSTINNVQRIMNLMTVTSKMLSKEQELKGSRSSGAVIAVANLINNFFDTLGFTLCKTTREYARSTALGAIVDAAVYFREKVRGYALTLPSIDEQKKIAALNLCDKMRHSLKDLGVSVFDVEASKSRWAFEGRGRKDGAVLKDIIDVVVEFRTSLKRKVIEAYPSRDTKNLLTIVKDTQMDFAALGVVIQENKNGFSFWTFDESKSLKPNTLHSVMDVLTSFLRDVHRSAQSMNGQEVREEILEMCSTVSESLSELGLTVNIDESDEGAKWSWKSQNFEGTSAFQTITDILYYSYCQAMTLLKTIDDKKTYAELASACRGVSLLLTKRTSAGRGTLTSDWASFVPEEKKKLVEDFINIAVHFLDKLNRIANSSKCQITRKHLLNLIRSLTQDLDDFGVVVERSPNWLYKRCSTR